MSIRSLPPSLMAALVVELSAGRFGRPDWTRKSTQLLMDALKTDSARVASRLTAHGEVDRDGCARLYVPSGTRVERIVFDPHTDLWTSDHRDGRGLLDLAAVVWSTPDYPIGKLVAADRLAALIGRATLSCLDGGTIAERWS